MIHEYECSSALFLLLNPPHSWCGIFPILSGSVSMWWILLRPRLCDRWQKQAPDAEFLTQLVPRRQAECMVSLKSVVSNPPCKYWIHGPTRNLTVHGGCSWTGTEQDLKNIFAQGRAAAQQFWPGLMATIGSSFPRESIVYQWQSFIVHMDVRKCLLLKLHLHCNFRYEQHQKCVST